MTPIRYILEYILLRPLMALFAALPLDHASALGGWLGRILGPRTGIHRVARRQMMDVLQGISEQDLEKNLTEMWDNLGRVLAEYPHLSQISKSRVVIDNHSTTPPDKMFQNKGLFIGLHAGNWEVAAATLWELYGLKIHLVYRPANNPWVDRLLWRYRSLDGALPTIPKSRAGARAIFDRIAAGEKVGILIDQKYTGGVTVPFLGKPARSTALYAQLGQRFDTSVYPAAVTRLPGPKVQFKLTLWPPLTLWAPDGSPRPVDDVVADAHRVFDVHIRAHPGQWLWVHRRWSSPGLDAPSFP